MVFSLKHLSETACADPEIFMRGGPTKMLIFGHRRGGVQPPKNPKITFFLGKIFKFQGGSGPPVPPSGSAHELFACQMSAVCHHDYSIIANFGLVSTDKFFFDKVGLPQENIFV